MAATPPCGFPTAGVKGPAVGSSSSASCSPFPRAPPPVCLSVRSPPAPRRSPSPVGTWRQLPLWPSPAAGTKGVGSGDCSSACPFAPPTSTSPAQGLSIPRANFKKAMGRKKAKLAKSSDSDDGSDQDEIFQASPEPQLPRSQPSRRVKKSGKKPPPKITASQTSNPCVRKCVKRTLSHCRQSKIDEDDKLGDVIDLPPPRARVITDVVWTKAEMAGIADEVKRVLKDGAGNSIHLKKFRYLNPRRFARDSRIVGNRFHNVDHVVFYKQIKKHKNQPVMKQRYIDWEGCRSMHDKHVL